MLSDNLLPPSPEEAKEVQQLAATKQRIMATGTVNGEGEDDDDDAPAVAKARRIEAAPAAKLSAPAHSRLSAPSSQKSELSHVTLSGCEIGITFGAVQQLSALFWPQVSRLFNN